MHAQWQQWLHGGLHLLHACTLCVMFLHHSRHSDSLHACHTRRLSFTQQQNLMALIAYEAGWSFYGYMHSDVVVLPKPPPSAGTTGGKQ